jgi:hypothetical protein
MPADPIGTLAGEQIVKKKPKVSQPPLKVTSRSRLLLALGCVTLLAALVYSTNLGSIQKIDFQEVERKEDYLRKIPIDAGPTETISEAQKILPKEDGTQSAVNLEAIESSSSTTIETSTSSHLQTNTPTATEIDTPSVVEDIVEEAKRRHGNSFGGINNVGSPGGAKAAANEDGVAFADIIIPVSNVGHATPSLNRANLVNLWGHYFHDEHYSPYASHLYKGKPKEELDTEQEKYIEKMKRVRKEWGAWDFQDPDPNKERKAANFNTPYKDLKVSNFPESSWQADKDYNILFLKESKALVKRMQHAIYAEYGWPLTDDMSAEDLDKHEKAWKIQVIEATDPGHPKGHWAGSMTDGIASLTKSAMDGLVRKLLHAMMTHDDFYAVLAGHSAAAGHGNNFQQNRILTFQQIMEPVFDKLGMRLISRNMAMGGVGTLQFSFAGGDLYGEADIIEWDSGMTENGVSVDFFNKQAILSGERVPVLITEKPFQILVETDGMAYLGRYINDKPIFPETTLENVQTLPYAAQWHDEKEDKYNAICWEPRSDFEPTLSQKDKPDSQLGWHPGNRRHTWSGRKLALIVLHGLSIALDVWEGGIQDAGVPLAEKYWHVRAEYESIREKLRTHVTTPQPDNADVRSPCEKMIPWLPRVCRVQMHGYGMWVPRAHADFDFLKLVHPAPNGYKPYYSQKNIYDGFDLLPYRQKLADSEIDVHAVAIATTDPAPELNHYWIEDEKIEIKTENATSPPTRQLLERASERATEQISIGKGKRRKSAKVHPVTSEIRTKNNRSHRNLDAADDIVPGRGWEVSIYCVH